MRSAYLHQLFQVHDVPGVGRTWAVKKDNDGYITLDSFLNWCGANGFELISFTVESQSRAIPSCKRGFRTQRRRPRSCELG